MAAPRELGFAPRSLPPPTARLSGKKGHTEESKRVPKAKGGGARGGRSWERWAHPVVSFGGVETGLLWPWTRLSCVCPGTASVPTSLQPCCVPPCGCVRVPLPTDDGPVPGFPLRSFCLFHHLKGGTPGNLVIFIEPFKTPGPPKPSQPHCHPPRETGVNTGLTGLGCQAVL